MFVIRYSVGLTCFIYREGFLADTSSTQVASKCGFDAFGNGKVTNSASHIKTYIEGTIERLGFAPDLYYLHRIDPGMS